MRCAPSQPAQHLEAVDARQPDVEDHQVEALALGRQHRLLATRHQVHRVALGLQDAHEAAAQGAVVLDDENAHGSIHHRRPSGSFCIAAQHCRGLGAWLG